MSHSEHTDAGQEELDFDAPRTGTESVEKREAEKLLEVCERLGYSPDDRADIEEGVSLGHKVSRALGLADKHGGPTKHEQLYDELIGEGIIEKPTQDPQH